MKVTKQWKKRFSLQYKSQRQTDAPLTIILSHNRPSLCPEKHFTGHSKARACALMYEQVLHGQFINCKN